MRQLTRDSFAPVQRPMRLKNPTVPVGANAYSNTDSLYDSFSVAQAAAFPLLTPMFQVPISGTKTKAQTNMRTAGTLANGETFKLRRVRCMFSSNTYPADAINILQLCSLTLQIGGRTFTEGNPAMYPAGGGGFLTAAANVGTVPSGSNIQSGYINGSPDIRAAFKFETDIEVENNEQILVNFVAETAFNMTASASGGVGTTIYVYLDGVRLRKAS